MRGDATQQRLAPLEVAEHIQVGILEIAAAVVDHLCDPRPLLLGGQPQRRAQTLRHRGVATDPGEHEGDRRQQTVRVEHADHVRPRRRTVEARTSGASSAAPVARTAPVGQPIGLTPIGDVAQQVWVDDRVPLIPRLVSRVVEQVEEPFAHQHVLPQRDRSMVVDHDRGVAAHGLNPAAEFLGIAHRRRQADQSHVVGQVQDHLFPYRPTHPVGKEVHLVHHDVRKAAQRRRIRVEHVAQHFGGHHHHRGVGIHRHVAGQQPDLLFTVARHEVVVLLVAQRLDRRGVETLTPGRQRQVHREFADNGLAGAGRRAHQHAVAPFQRRAGPPLERVELEFQFRCEPGQFTRQRYGVR